MSTEANKALIRRYYELNNQGTPEAAVEMATADFVCWVGGQPEPIRGIEANVKLDRAFRQAFSGLQLTPNAMIAEGDLVAVRREWSMTHTGEFQGIAPTGREIRGTALELFRIQDGKLAEMWTESDNYSFLAQLGALPTPEQEHGL